ncbi:MAG: hypothetical protein GX416_13615 [Bacteroidales bacterium]|nr:hypothetical protein [Bacteroidales bacterium]
MIASVQYNDLKGTAAADVSDHLSNSLQKFLVDTYKSFDGDRYSCHGCTMWISNKGYVLMEFICYDNVEHKYLKFIPENHYLYQDAFNLFKRFEIVIGTHIDEIEVDSEDVQALI